MRATVPGLGARELQRCNGRLRPAGIGLGGGDALGGSRRGGLGDADLRPGGVPGRRRLVLAAVVVPGGLQGRLRSVQVGLGDGDLFVGLLLRGRSREDLSDAGAGRVPATRGAR
jgi:hypothetical protein